MIRDRMDSVVRLLLRFLLVPLGYVSAALAEALVVSVASWQRFRSTFAGEPGGWDPEVVGAFFEDQFMLFLGLAAMLTPIVVGILIAEALAIRSWIFHVLNAVVSCWIGWQVYGGAGNRLIEPMVVIAAGIAGGFAYWVVAGSSAGFWKPVFRDGSRPPAPATSR